MQFTIKKALIEISPYDVLQKISVFLHLSQMFLVQTKMCLIFNLSRENGWNVDDTNQK